MTVLPTDVKKNLRIAMSKYDFDGAVFIMCQFIKTTNFYIKNEDKKLMLQKCTNVIIKHMFKDFVTNKVDSNIKIHVCRFLKKCPQFRPIFHNQVEKFNKGKYENENIDEIDVLCTKADNLSI
jgi:hypothetical protein